MKVTEVYIKNFGKFHEEKIAFHDGINLFYGENESGKTTIHTFIKSMLFGLERGRGRAAVGDTYSLYEPWDNPNHYAGVLRFESGGKNFRLTRSFDKYGKNASLICEDDGEEFSLEDGDLEVILPGITASNYENTIAIGQMKVETSPSLAQELQNYATNYYATGNSDINLVGAQEILLKQKKDVEKEIRIIEQERQQRRRDMERDINGLERDTQEILGKIREIDREIDAQTVSPKGAESVNKSHEVLKVIGLLAAIALAGIAFAYLAGPLRYVVSLGILAADILLTVLSRGKEQVMDQEDSASKLLGKRELLEEEWNEKKIKYENMREVLEELDEKDEAYKQKEKMRDALDFAMQQLTILSKETGEEVAIRLNGRVSQIVKEITGGKYELLRVDSNLKISLYTEGRMVGLEQVSRGTIEQIYFALRMAASEVLHEEEYPVILDDTFVFYDEKRLENTLRWLEANKKQVILFTCQKREGEILSRN